MVDTCADVYQRRMTKFSFLIESDRSHLAQTICSQGNVIWPFAAAHDERRFNAIAEQIPVASERATVLGLAGGTPYYASEVMHALRFEMYEGSSLHAWLGDHEAFRAWRNSAGTRWGGIIYVRIDQRDGEGRQEVELKIARARGAIAFAKDPANQLGNFTLIVDNRVDEEWVRQSLPVANWLTLDGCQARLSPGA